MVQTSDIWKSLVQKYGTLTEYQFDINGKIYGAESELEHTVDNKLFEEFGFGNACCASLTLSLYADDIPRGATIKRYVRLRNGEQVSEWLPYGTFFANRRSDDDGRWTIEAFDSMRKGDVVWTPDQSLEFPMPMDDAAQEFARIMGVEIDSRTSLNHSYTIDYPANDYTIRNELEYIAAAHGGNWIMTYENRLYLVPLGSEPPETYFLVDETGSAILLGEVRLLV